MFLTLLTAISVGLLIGAILLGVVLIVGVVRKKPPFAPGTEPRHYWEMSREEAAAIGYPTAGEAAEEQSLSDSARRRDEALEKDAALAEFDPITTYPATEGMEAVGPVEIEFEKQLISDLITSMTINKASHWEMVRAVRHSMVLIDAEKHQLNYKQSEIDNGIAQLEDKYL